MIDELLLVEDPGQEITVDAHTMDAAGTVRLTLRLADGATHKDPQITGGLGTLTVQGDDLLVSWTWGAMMAPTDPVGTCTAALRRELAAWAARWAGGPIDLT